MMNNDLPVLSKARPDHISLDFDRLRAEGIRHLEQMATELWTDFNAHDPGITLLELLCYALTDLAYRTRMISIEDLVAGDGKLKSWFEAEEILPCSPVTASDYRKLLIDVRGVKNAWLERAGKKGIGFEDKNGTRHYVESSALKWSFRHIIGANGGFDEEKFRAWAKPFVPRGTGSDEIDKLALLVQDLVLANNFAAQKTQFDNIGKLPTLGFFAEKIRCELAYLPLSLTADETKGLWLNGINKVILDLDDAVNPRNILPAKAIAQRALNALHAHRGICQDFLEPVLVEHRPICLCLDIEINEDADAQVVAAEAIYRIQNFFTPTPRFYTFKEMLAKGYRSDEIFNGPLLANGFLDDTELEQSKLPANVIFMSDLLDIAAEVPGVLSVRDIRVKYTESVTYPPLSNFRFPQSAEDQEKIKHKIVKFVVDPCCSAVHVTRGVLHWSVAGEKLEEEIAALRLLREGPPGIEPGRLEYPTGAFRPDLDEYMSLQYDLPGIYKVGEFAPPETAPTTEIALTRQLQAYLLFFDQILAGYLAQLGQVREVLAIDQNVRKPAAVLPILFQTPGVRQLMGDFVEFKFEAQDCGTLNAAVEVKSKALADELDALTVALAKANADGKTELALEIKKRKQEVELEKNRREQAPDEVKTLINKGFVGLTNFRSKLWEALGDNFEVFGHLPEEAVWTRYISLKENNLIEEMGRIAEPPARHNDRRNRLLDHLLARFGETFSEYVVALARADQEPEDNPWQQDFGEYLRDKANFLLTLPALQSERGQGYNYRKLDDGQPDVWNTDNVSGLQKRVCRLLGIDSFMTRSLIAEPPYVLDLVPYPSKQSSPQYALALRRNPGAGGPKDPLRREPLLLSKKFSGKKTALDARAELYTILDDDIANNFKVEETAVDGQPRWQVVFRAPSKLQGVGEHELRGTAPSQSEANYLLRLVQDLIQPDAGRDREGFHLIEHILLRPDDTRDDLLELTLGCDTAETPDDPYSFWLTVVLPGWTRRFRHPDFRQFLEQTFRRETPAHLAVRFCWLDRDEMQIFQPLFKNWLEEKARCRPNACNVTDAANVLIEWLNDTPCSCYCGEKDDDKSPCDPHTP